MKTVLYVICLVSLAGLGASLAPCSLFAQPSNGQVERVFRDWQMRHDTIQRMRYLVKGQSIIPRGSATDDMGKALEPPEPAKDIAQKQDTVLLLDIPGTRFRMEQETQFYNYGQKKLLPLHKITIFDGNTLYGEIPREVNAQAGYVRQPLEPDLCISKNYAAYRPLKAINAYWLSPLLFAHGLVPQLAAAPSFLDKLDIDDFNVRGQAVHAGKTCLVLRTFPVPSGTARCFDEYWVDVSRDSAVLRHLAYMNDKLLTDLDVSYQQTTHGWIPLSWVGITRDYTKGNLINVTRLRAQEFSFEPLVAESDFRVDVKPGMVILEDDFGSPKVEQGSLRPQRKSYQVATDGHWQEIGMQSGLPVASTWRRWLSLAEIVVVITVGYSVVRRVKRGLRRRCSSPVR